MPRHEVADRHCRSAFVDVKFSGSRALLPRAAGQSRTPVPSCMVRREAPERDPLDELGGEADTDSALCAAECFFTRRSVATLVNESGWVSTPMTRGNGMSSRASRAVREGAHDRFVPLLRTYPGALQTDAARAPQKRPEPPQYIFSVRSIRRHQLEGLPCSRIPHRRRSSQPCSMYTDRYA